MSASMNYASDLSLAGLMENVQQTEPGAGPVDGLGYSTNGGVSVSIVSYDGTNPTGNTESFLALSGNPPPGYPVAFAIGQCFVSGNLLSITSYVAMDTSRLAVRTSTMLQAVGWTRAQAIGIIASIQGESNFDPSVYGDNGTAYGLCQWRGSRQGDFQQALNKPIIGSSYYEQVEFIIWELSHTEHVAGSLLRATTNVSDAATAVCVNYERPKSPTIETGKRVAFALTLDQMT